MVSANRAQGSQFQPLARQGSIYNPSSFDEVQSQMGKPMNLNEFLKNAVSGSPEDGNVVQNPSSSSSSSSSPPASYFLGNINLNGKLSKKTIDEVWKEIVHHEHVNEVDNQSVQQQLTLGETTLEDFLLRAGVINIGNGNQNVGINHDHHQPFMAIDPMVVVSQQSDWLHFQMTAAAQHHQHHHHQHQMAVMDTSYNVSESVYNENPVAEIGYSEDQLGLTMPVPAIPATPSSDSRVVNNERKRRYSDEIMEKTIERRQKRMIKNRESAARSRARKQVMIKPMLIFHLIFIDYDCNFLHIGFCFCC